MIFHLNSPILRDLRAKLEYSVEKLLDASCNTEVSILPHHAPNMGISPNCVLIFIVCSTEVYPVSSHSRRNIWISTHCVVPFLHVTLNYAFFYLYNQRRNSITWYLSEKKYFLISPTRVIFRSKMQERKYSKDLRQRTEQSGWVDENDICPIFVQIFLQMYIHMLKNNNIHVIYI